MNVKADPRLLSRRKPGSKKPLRYLCWVWPPWQSCLWAQEPSAPRMKNHLPQGLLLLGVPRCCWSLGSSTCSCVWEWSMGWDWGWATSCAPWGRTTHFGFATKQAGGWETIRWKNPEGKKGRRGREQRSPKGKLLPWRCEWPLETSSPLSVCHWHLGFHLLGTKHEEIH